MDLLDQLEDREASTFHVQVDTQVINAAADAQTQADQSVETVADKVRHRLKQLNGPTDLGDTQPIDAPQWNDFAMDTSILATPQADLPQLDAADAEILQPTHPKEERMAKILRLAELKRQQRLQEQKEREQERLLADISHTTLTDEEDDLREDHKNTAALQEAEEFLQTQKRVRNLQPSFEKRLNFTATDLLREFDNDESPKQSHIGLKSSDDGSSPITSPLKTKGKHGPGSDPVSHYTQHLPGLLSSPSKDEAMINLDEESEEEHHSVTIPVVPALSKDEVLHIKQKFLLKKLSSNPKSSLIHLPKSIRNSINSHERNRESKNLINHLQRANINQIQLHRQENPLRDEMIDLEEDEETMGSLLEREMERARNIRKKEKMMEKAKAALLSGELDNVDNGAEDEVPESEFEQSSDNQSDDDAGSINGSDVDASDRVRAKKRTKRVLLSEDESQDNKALVPRTLDDGDTANPRTKSQLDAEKLHISDTQTQESPGTQDISHLKVPSFQNFSQSQTPSKPPTTLIATQVDDTQVVENDDDDEDITPANVRKAKSLLKRVTLHEDVEDNLAEDEEEAQRQIIEYERKIRRLELKARKKRKDMERRGLKNILEGEAEESEDEWQGLGGADVELSDQANSEDERMIDNDLNIDLNDEEVKRKFMEQYQIKDKRELEKLLDDIKNHKLTKRIGSKNGFDIELSDEEDELLSAYRRQRIAEQKSRLLQTKRMQNLAKDDKSRAFFVSIQDSTLAVKIDDEVVATDSDKENVSEHDDADKTLEEELDLKKKRTIKIKESFVQKQLSFLTSVGNEDEEYNHRQRISSKQHGYSSGEEEFDDLQTMKRKCMDNLVLGRSVSPPASKGPALEGKGLATDVDDTDSDADAESGLFASFKRPSLVKRFKSHSGSLDADSFSGVVIRKQYKSAGAGPKPSISGLGLKRQLDPSSMSLKEKRITNSITRSHQSGHSLFENLGFEG